MKLRVLFALTSIALMAGVFVLSVNAGYSGCPGDVDEDGICDDDDNCLGVGNPTQYDADYDGYGNICDYDVNNDCNVGAGDISVVISSFGAPAPNPSDINQANGLVDAGDISAIIAGFGTGPIGPSGKSCAVCPSPVGTGAGACP